MHYTYLLRSLKDGKFYTGCTNDLRRRLAEHEKGLSFSTAPRRPFRLVYYEAYLHRKDAEKREQWFKTGWGRNYIKRILHHYLSEKI